MGHGSITQMQGVLLKMSIQHCEKCNSFFLSTKRTSYVLRVTAEGYLYHAYYGKRLPNCDLSYYKPEIAGSHNPTIPGSKARMTSVMNEYGTADLGDYREPALIPLDERGSRTCDLKYDSFEILAEKPSIRSGIPTARGGETLKITLRDNDTGLLVYLYYTVYEEEDTLTRRAEIVNSTAGVIHLERALSMTLDLYDHDYEMVTFIGRHAGERTQQVNNLIQGRVSIGNTRGITSHHHSPIIILRRPNTTEEQGEVLAASLTYCGSHYGSVEVDESYRTRIAMGINPESFDWKLEVGDSFETPEVVLTYSAEGMGGITRRSHDFFRNHMISPRWVNARRPVVLNSWEGMHFTFDRDRLFDTIDRIEGLGIDTFVLDDGWFGARNHDRAGLGDWYVNEEKLPGGLGVIADRCHKRGLKFGLWIEPEMVNPDSDLYRAHPDWAIATPDRPLHLGRNQLVLDFSRAEVVDYIKNVMHKVISESGAEYIKWDMNRSLCDNWSGTLPADRQGEVQHRYALGVYELASYLTSSFPNIFFEGCCGGGGRFDASMFAFFPQIWTSDNTDAYDRVQIQYGTEMIYPLSESSNHVSLSPNIRNGRVIGADTRRNVAFFGSYGYEFDVNKVPADELERMPADIEKYHEISSLIREGDLYRGINYFDGQRNEMLQTVVSKDGRRAVTVYFQALDRLTSAPHFKVPGLSDDLVYNIEELGLTLPGAVLKNVGLTLPRFKHDFGSVLLTFTAVED